MCSRPTILELRTRFQIPSSSDCDPMGWNSNERVTVLKNGSHSERYWLTTIYDI